MFHCACIGCHVYTLRAVEASSWTTLNVHNEDPTPVIWTGRCCINRKVMPS